MAEKQWEDLQFVGLCERCGKQTNELTRTRQGITGTPGPWLCVDCARCQEALSTDGAASEEVDESNVALRPSSSGSVMSPAPRTPATRVYVMPERPLSTALDRMMTWLDDADLTADQAKLCELLLKKLQLCAASVMNAQLRRSWKPRDAS